MSESIETGGPAYPCGEKWRTVDLAGGVTNHSRGPLHPGMTLRDHFAGLALQGVMADPASADSSETAIANACYRMADAMMEARKR